MKISTSVSRGDVATKRFSERGFTILEIMIATSIFSIMTAALLPFVFYMTENTFVSSEELKFNNSVRGVGADIQKDIREAAFFHVYDSFDLENRNSKSDQLMINDAGNLVVLFKVETVYTTDPTHEIITQITGYYVDSDNVNPDSTVSVKRWEIKPGDNEVWYVNPKINQALYTPSWRISPSNSFSSREDYFANVDSDHSSIETVLKIKPSERGLFQNRGENSIVLTASTLFGNNAANISQTVHYSVTTEG